MWVYCWMSVIYRCIGLHGDIRKKTYASLLLLQASFSVLMQALKNGQTNKQGGFGDLSMCAPSSLLSAPHWSGDVVHPQIWQSVDTMVPRFCAEDNSGKGGRCRMEVEGGRDGNVDAAIHTRSVFEKKQAWSKSIRGKVSLVSLFCFIARCNQAQKIWLQCHVLYAQPQELFFFIIYHVTTAKCCSFYLDQCKEVL